MDRSRRSSVSWWVGNRGGKRIPVLACRLEGFEAKEGEGRRKAAEQEQSFCKNFQILDLEFCGKR